jgi:poly(3-hydroxybutyrate) depolymerase
MMKYFILSIATVCLLAIPGASSRQFRPSQSEAINQTFNVDGGERTAIIYPNTKPASKTGEPLTLGFHGHGGRTDASKAVTKGYARTEPGINGT